MKQILRTRWIVAAALVGVLLLVALYSLFGSLNGSSERIVYIDSDDTVDSVYNKVCSESHFPANSTFNLLTSVFDYGKHIRPGRYDVGSGTGVLSVFRNLRNGNQTPTRLTIPVLRTTRDLADLLGRELHAPADSFLCRVDQSRIVVALRQDARNGSLPLSAQHLRGVLDAFRPRHCWLE